MSLKDELIDEGFNIGVNGLHPSVLAHVRHVAGKDVETQKEKEEEQRRMRQVTFLRKPGPVNATFFQRVGKEWVLLDSPAIRSH